MGDRVDSKKFQVFVGNVSSQTTDEKLRSVFEVSLSVNVWVSDAATVAAAACQR